MKPSFLGIFQEVKEKCCRNCLFFIDKSRPEKYPSANWILEFTCHLHGSEARITDPEFQFCGDEHWILDIG